MKTRIWIALVALYIVWGSTYLAIRFAVESIPPFLSAGLRFLIAGLMLVAWRRTAGDPWPSARQWRSVGIVGFLLLLGGNGMVSFAEQYIPSGISALIVGTVPMWLTVFEAVRPQGARPGWQSILGLLIGFGGIFLLVGPAEFNNSQSQTNWLGLAAIFLAPFLWALGSIYSRNADMPASTLMSTGTEMLMGSVSLFIFSVLTREWRGFNFAQVAFSSWLGLAYLITFGSLIGFVAYGWLLHNAPVSLVGTYAYVNPLVAILLGSWLASETLNARIVIAALIIVGSVVLINTSKQSEIVQAEEEAAPPAAD